MSLLKIKDLRVSVEGKEILKGFNLEVNEGETHAIMGPNGTGKSTLAAVVTGKEGFEVTEGSVLFNDENIMEMEPEDRARAGIFLAFQYPVEIPGVSNANFMKTAVNEKRRHRGEEPLDAMEFMQEMKQKASLVEIDKSFFSRSVNEGFSGGEKKRNEIFQMAMMDPKLGILDETDSGLDIDALKVVANGVNKLRRKDNAFVVITHYQRLLNYVIPDFVHILYDGQIVKSGGKDLALELEERGYDWVKKELYA